MLSVTKILLQVGVVLSIVSESVTSTINQKVPALHHRMTKREISNYFGANSHSEVPEYEVISPFQADETGEFLSHELRKRSRRKRSTDQPNNWFYNMEAFGFKLHLNVTKSRHILAPGAIVETVHENGSKSYAAPPKNTFYSGHVVSHPGSVVAVSNHDGLSGMINLIKQALFIQPLPNHLAKDYGSFSGAQPHLIFKRSLGDVIGRGCDISDSHERMKRSLEIKRSVSHKHLEVAIVADDLVVKNRGEENLERHLLMLIHLVDSMFHDESVGEKKVSLVVVKLEIKKDGFGYDSSASNHVRLSKVKAWGDNLPESDDDPKHADIVILLTGDGFGGLAAVGSTCSSEFGKTVNNDIGLTSAIIIAHETAHTFGVGHDEERCNNGYIMASVVSDGENAFKWSNCSRTRIQEFLTIVTNPWQNIKSVELKRGSENSRRVFLHPCPSCKKMGLKVRFCSENKALGVVFPDSGSGSECLDDNPHNFTEMPSVFHKKLPGQIVNATLQCRLQFGQGYFHCPQRKADCGVLYCTNDGYKCISRGAPPVDGTRCGDRHWCIKGECEDDGSAMIDGGWSDWLNTHSCTQTCGGGVTWKTRSCTNPVPQNGGKNCEGSNKGSWEMCNTKPCPEGSTDYRLTQCQAFDPKSVVHWRSDPCILECRRGSYATPRGRVKDGTRCNSNPMSKDVCIEGVCQPVGCDMRLNSGVKYDHCAVCGGDSSTCSFVSGLYTENYRKWGPNKPGEIITIPAGSTNVFAKVKGNTKNMLGVKRAADGKWVYNVAYTWSTVVKAAGTKVAYDHEDYVWKDEVDIPGPTKEALKLMYVFIEGANPGVEYHFLSPQRSDVTADQVKWMIGGWGACTQDCAGGYRTRLVECVRKDDGSYVNDKVCLKSGGKPAMQQACNTQPCQPEWYLSGWRPCSKTCGKGIQLRTIVCRRKKSQEHYETVEESSCTEQKPVGNLQQECNMIACPAEWKHLAWSECTRSCGGGTMTRSLKCMKLNAHGMLVTVSDYQCSHTVKPTTEEKCNTDIECPGSILSPDGKRFIALGCFKDAKKLRAVPDLVTNMRGKIDWRHIENTVKECAHIVTKKNSTLKVFALQFYGECWTGVNAEKSYSEYGASPNCWNGVGGTQTNFVYEFIDDDDKSP